MWLGCERRRAEARHHESKEKWPLESGRYTRSGAKAAAGLTCGRQAAALKKPASAGDRYKRKSRGIMPLLHKTALELGGFG